VATLDEISVWYLLKVLFVFSIRFVISGAGASCVWGAALLAGSFFPIGRGGIHSDFAVVAAALMLVAWIVCFWLIGRLVPFPFPRKADPYARR